jgi:hypothetical protein
MADEKNDEYSRAATTIRETAKWLVTAFAAPVAILIGTSPFAGLGSLSPLRLGFAVVAGLVCVFLAGWAIKVASDVLVLETFFFSDIPKDRYLIKFIFAHRRDLLPVGTPSLGRFLRDRRANIDGLSYETEKSKKDELQKDFSQFEAFTTRLVGLCNFERTRRKFERVRIWLFVLAAGGVAALGIFLVATSKDGSQEKQPTQIFYIRPSG